MLSKYTTYSAALVAIAAALLPVASAAPIIGSRSSSCTSLGKGPLGFNASLIGIYQKTPPQTYITIHDADQTLAASTAPKSDNQTTFEFFQCLYTAPPYEGKGSIDTYQGYIQAPDGSCVTATALNDPNANLKTAACSFSDDASRGGVDPSQHFQFQLFSFDEYYTAVFLGELAGPVQQDSFGEGGNYHYRIGTDNELDLNYQADQPQNGNASEMLIGQLGTQYQRPKPEFPACTLVKQGAIELVNTATGESTPVTVSSNTQYALDDVMVVNGTQSYDGFEFYSCNSTYMGYVNDENNFYGHFKTPEQSNQCYMQRYYVNGPEPIVYESVALDGECENTDTGVQTNTFFHLAKGTDGYYQLSFLGKTAGSNDTLTYGWTIDSANYNEVNLNPNPSSNTNVTNYNLRFVN